MSPQKVNARVVLPVTTLDEVLHGYPADILLYANNYEEVDEDHPLWIRFASCQEALHVSVKARPWPKAPPPRPGLSTAISPTSSARPSIARMHEHLAEQTFRAAFKYGLYVGQLRTRLGIKGYETDGPQEAAKALFALISELNKQ